MSNDTQTMTLSDFLLARVAEDEAAAKAAIGAATAKWGTDGYRVVADGEFEVADASVPAAAHIARHDPARILAQCAAVRAVVAAHDTQCADDDPSAWIVGSKILLRALAAVYADHPDYRDEWRP